MTLVIWSDLHPSLSKDTQGNIRISENVDAVIGAIDNILRTRRGERVMLPEFGSDLSDMVFELADQDLFDRFSSKLMETLSSWDDRVIVNSINARIHPDSNLVDLKISFSIRGYDKVFEYSSTLQSV